MNTTSHHRIDPLTWLVRLAWGRRLETGLTLAITVARVGLVLSLGPQTGTLTLAALAIGLVSYRPGRDWTLRFYRRERLERDCIKAFSAADIEVAVAPTVVAQRPTPSGAVFDLVLSPRCTVKDLAARTEPLAVAFGAAGVRIREDRTAAGRAQLIIAYTDPLAEAAITWPWIGIERTQLWGGIPLGYDEDDSLVVLELAGHHLLLGGEPGAGKSNALSLIVAAAALDPNAELWCFDGKLVELASWRRSCRRFVGPDLEEATKVLIELQGEMEARYVTLLERGLRSGRDVRK